MVSFFVVVLIIIIVIVLFNLIMKLFPPSVQKEIGDFLRDMFSDFQ